MLQIILGQYLNDKVVYLILSSKSYSNVSVKINGSTYEKINIKAYKVNKYYLSDIKIGSRYVIDFKKGDKILDSIQINLKSNPFDNVLVVNCDSCYGYETGTWNLIENNQTRIIFHLGDQLYNDHMFHNSYNMYKLDITKEEEKIIYRRCYYHYLQHFSRNNKSNVLKNNFNLMIPDDHEIVDNSIEIMFNMYNFEIIKKLLEELCEEIELGLKQNSADILFIPDDKNSTVYILNYLDKFDESIYLKYNYLDWVKKYNNIIFLNRKCISSVKNSKLNQIVFKTEEYELYDIDYLLKIKLKPGYSNKEIYVLCGDYHMKNTLEYTYKGKKLLTIKNVGAINTVIDIFKVDFILKTALPEIKLKESTIKQNGFIDISYKTVKKNNKIEVKDIINKKNILYHLANSIVSAKEFLTMKYL